ncbi:hypothetical protein T03_9585, partial [Trichinella britovi]
MDSSLVYLKKYAITDGPVSVSPKELVFKLEGTNGILHQNCIPICSFWPILI